MKFDGCNLWFVVNGKPFVVRVYGDLSYTMETDKPVTPNDIALVLALAERLTDWIAGHLRPSDDDE